ncbi:lantibiotic dehydratase [Actinoplanes sp. NPDC049599]|uniref:lantibiotic dehydratase n=1 Tax=Actinoplanes sp. NPDC049599 TaxID=3363903 RepID=UPI00378AD6AB
MSAAVSAGSDFLPLPGGNWRIWRGIVLRSAGFPIRMVTELADPHLSDVADRALAEPGSSWITAATSAGYRAEFAAAGTRVAATVRSAAVFPPFREAVSWQNLPFVANCLDRVTDMPAGRDSRWRKREGAIANYLQRYTTKCESIGFFGPVGWASWAPDRTGSRVVAGPELLSRRTVYFESWAMDVVATALASRPELRHGVPPRRNPAVWYGTDDARLPSGRRVQLSDAEAAVLRRCDGHRTVRDIGQTLALPEEELLALLDRLQKSQLVRVDFTGPIESRSERRLRDRLSRVPEPAARDRALADLDRLVESAAAVAAAAGDAERLGPAMAALGDEFTQITGENAVRGHGRAYAGRTVVFEDTVRDVSAEFGGDVLRALGPPLSLLLDSGRWLAARTGQDYLARFEGYFERRQRTPGAEVPLASLLALATRDLYTGSGMPAAAAAAIGELRQKWDRILSVPAGVRRHSVTPDEIAERVRVEFATDRPPWASGLQHSPDIMICAESADAVSRGDFSLVLGELHLGFNTVESRALVDQSPDPARLLAMAESSAGPGRIVPVAPREWGTLTRTVPPSALISPGYTYWAMSSDDVVNLPGGAVPLGSLHAARGPKGIEVRCLADGRTFPLVEVIGEYLSWVLLNAFRILPPRRHVPRVSIGRLIVARETWRFAPRACDWVNQLDESRRYLQMREWVRRAGLPREAFCVTAIERKPIYVDFTSLPLTSNLAAVIRRMDRDGADGQVTISEMLPDRDSCWLTDADGEKYAAELRMVVTEHVA